MKQQNTVTEEEKKNSDSKGNEYDNTAKKSIKKENQYVNIRKKKIPISGPEEYPDHIAEG